jgi:hypothetical protein
MRLRLSAVLVILLLLLMTVTTAAAQHTGSPVYCGTLPETDCALLENAYTRLFALHSGSFEFRYWFAVDDGTPEGATVSEIVTGAFTNFDATTLFPLDHTALFGAVNLDAIVETVLPTGLPAVTPDIPAYTQGRVLLVDGLLYVDLDALAAVVGDSYSGWGSYPLDLSPHTEQNTLQVEPLVTGLDADELIAAFEPAFVRQFLTVTRAGDTEGSAVFQTFVDMKGLYAAPEFRELLRKRLEATRTELNQSPSIVTDDQLDNLAAKIGEWYPEPLLLYTHSVDLESGFLHSFVTWDMFDVYPMIESAARGYSTWDPYPINMSVAVSGYNQPQDITAPPEATPLDYETVMRVPISGSLPLLRPDKD